MKLKISALVCAAFFLNACNQQPQTSAATASPTTTPPTAVAGQDPEWVYISKAQDGATWYIKSTAEAKDANSVKLWGKEVGAEDDENGQHYTNVTKQTLCIYDCTHRKILTLRAIVYDELGHVLKDTGLLKGTWQDVVPGSMGETVISKVSSLFEN